MVDRPGGPTAQLASRLKAHEFLLTAWSSIPNPIVSDALARTAFPLVTLDMQHGFHDVASILAGIGAINHVGKGALVRVPVGDWAMCSRALDFGAAGVIAPMVNSADDARHFVEAMKYPPVGSRSWGPHRAMAINRYPTPQSYLENANNDTVAVAMIETRSAMENLDEILAVPGIDGIFVGPADTSVSWSEGKIVNPGADFIIDDIKEIRERSFAAGKFCCTFAITPELLKKSRDYGYSMIAVGPETLYFNTGVNALISGLENEE